MTAIEHQSKYESRLVADAIQQKLPRELRDMIYSLLWTEELEKYDHHTNERPWRATEVTNEDMETYPDDWRSHCGFPANPREKALGPYPQLYFVDPEFMGRESAQEAAEIFYRLADAYIETLNKDCLEDYFRHDNFAVGVEPRAFTTSITFFLDMCIRRDKRPGPWRSFWGILPTLHLEEAGVESIFGSDMSRLPKITFLVRNEKPATAIATLERSLDLYGQLKALGASIDVHTCLTRDEGPSTKSVHLGTILEMPRYEWEGHFLREFKRQDPKSYTWVESCI
jgi:hypothetical protein